jgi:hypothetical protein
VAAIIMISSERRGNDPRIPRACDKFARPDPSAIIATTPHHQMGSMLELSILLIVRTTTEALAQSHSFYDSSGRIADRSTTDSSGATVDAIGDPEKAGAFLCGVVFFRAKFDAGRSMLFVQL